MSRKKALKGAKGKSPKASPCKDGGGKSVKCAAAASGGAVHPSAPAVSSSGGFYDVAFKVSARQTRRGNLAQSGNPAGLTLHRRGSAC